MTSKAEEVYKETAEEYEEAVKDYSMVEEVEKGQ